MTAMSSMSRCRLRDICRGRAGQWLDVHSTAWASTLRLIFRPYTSVTATRAAHHRSSIGVRARYHGGDARAWPFTVMHNVHVSKIRRSAAQPRAVKAYSSAEDSSLVDAPAFFRLIVRDVERELQGMPEDMRQAVMLAAVSTDGYVGGEPGRRTEGAPVYKQPPSGNRLLKGGPT
jgi:hypothetical protein